MLGLCMKVVVFLSSNQLKRKYNARDFEKSKSANLLKILKSEYPTKKWKNCGTEVLCVMLYYNGAELEDVEEWLKTDKVGCLQKFSY